MHVLWGAVAVAALAVGGLYLAGTLASDPGLVTGASNTALTGGACSGAGTGQVTDLPGMPVTPGGQASGCPRSSPPASPPPPATPSPSRSPARKKHPARRHHSAHPSSPAAGASPTAPPAPHSPPPSQSGLYGQAEAQVLALINQARAQQGLPAYTSSSGLVTSASGHTQVMAGGCGLSHQCPGEPPLGTRETNAGVHWTSAGENIGEAGPIARTSGAIAQAAVGLTQDMLNEKPPDDGHRLNILSSSFRHAGISVLIDSSGTVWMTQDFSN
jgi:uncharacterized protein YkwD